MSTLSTGCRAVLACLGTHLEQRGFGLARTRVLSALDAFAVRAGRRGPTAQQPHTAYWIRTWDLWVMS
jgi:hypothetical protein